MPLNLKPIATQSEWEQIIIPNQPNTFLQSWEWGETQIADGESVQRLAVFDDSQAVAAAHVILVNAKRGRHYLIPHGPLFFNDHLAGESLDLIISHLKQTSRANQAVGLRIAPLQITSSANIGMYTSRHFRPAPMHVHTELTWVLDITPASDQILAGMRKTTRHAIRKAENIGITCEVITDPSAIDRFWPLYDTTRQRHNFVPFSRDFLDKQWQSFAPQNRIFAVLARYQNKDVAAGIFLSYADTVFYHHGASVKLTGNIPAAQLLQWTAIQEAKRRGGTRYNFWGIAPANQPRHPFAGITVFKTGFGGQAFDYLHAQDLPFSWRYWQLWAVDTYRKHRRGFA